MKVLRLSTGIAMVCLSVCGIAHGIRAATAQVLYFQARHGRDKESGGRILTHSRKAHKLYPYNYNVCAIAADTAFSNSRKASVENATRKLVTQSVHWCNLGLNLNFYDRRLRLTKTILLSDKEETKDKAIRFWEEYTDWNYWNPHNHCVLALMYALRGDFQKAESAASLIKGSEYFPIARRIILAEKERRQTE